MVAVMGLDLSLRHTGVAVVGRGYELLYSGVFHTPSAHKNSEIDCVMCGIQQRDRLIPIIRRFDPNVVVIEGPSYGSGAMASRAAQLWQATGIVKTAVVGMGAEIVIIAPSSLKKAITGNGRAEKKDMIKAIEERFGLGLSDNNAVDAFALAVCYLDRSKDGQGK